MKKQSTRKTASRASVPDKAALDEAKAILMAHAPDKPRLSVNKLAEYIISDNPLRRRTILTDAKFPPAFKMVRYQAARHPLFRYIQTGDDSHITTAIARLERITGGSKFEKDDRGNTILLLKKLATFEYSIFAGWDHVEFDYKRNRLVDIRGVDVSICPDLVLRKKKGKADLVGAVKYHISKNAKPDPKAQEIVAMLLHDYVDDKLSVGSEVTFKKMCVSLDLFTHTFEIAPTSTVRLMDKVEAACEEIVDRWPSITPPKSMIASTAEALLVARPGTSGRVFVR